MTLIECIFVFGFLSVGIICLTLLGLKQSRIEKELHDFRIALAENTQKTAEEVSKLAEAVLYLLERRSSDEQK